MAKDKDETPTPDREEQTPEQFTPLAEPSEVDEDVPASHATKGMTVLGYTEASRIEGSHDILEKERRAFERRAAREK